MTYRKFDLTRDREAFSEYFNDFFQYAAADWTITTTEAGANSATEAIADGPHGVLVLTNDDANNDADYLQLKGEIAKFVPGKKLQFGARFKLNDATASAVVIGLQITDTTPLAVSDGIFFRKDASSKLLKFVAAKNSVESVLTGVAGTVGELADDTFVDVEFYYAGKDSVDAYVNGTRIGSVPLTNVPDDEDLTISFGIANGAAAAKVMSIDYVFVRAER